MSLRQVSRNQPQGLKWMLFLILSLAMAFQVGCLNTEDEPEQVVLTRVFISPQIPSLAVGNTQRFFASGGLPPYVFSAFYSDVTSPSLADSIDAITGEFTAPETLGLVSIVATDANGDSATWPLIITEDLQISPRNSIVVETFSINFMATGGLPPYTYSLRPGDPGTINAVTGVYQAARGATTVVVRVTDAVGNFDSTLLSVVPLLSVSEFSGELPTNSQANLIVSGGLPPYEIELQDNPGGRVSQIRDDVTQQTLLLINLGPLEGPGQINVTDSLGYTSAIPFEAFYGRMVQTSGNSSCGVNIAGDVKCWGAGTTATRQEEISWTDPVVHMGNSLVPLDFGLDGAMAPIEIVEMTPFSGRQQGTDIPEYNSHACAILNNGQTKCWGLGAQGQLGLGDGNSQSNSRTRPAANLDPLNFGAQTAVQISVGFQFTCAILNNGRVRCWGQNRNGVLGRGFGDGNTIIGRSPNQLTFGDVNLGTDGGGNPLLAASIVTSVMDRPNGNGDSFACVILQGSEEVKCWGAAARGQLGADSPFDRGSLADGMGNALPTAILEAPVAQLSAGWAHVCALLKAPHEGRVKCWGDNSIGQLGFASADVAASLRSGTSHGTVNGSMAAIPMVDFGTAEKVIHLASAAESNCAVFESGRVKCWGRNDSGNLGTGSTLGIDSTTTARRVANVGFVALEATFNVQKLYMHSNATCAMGEDTADSNKIKLKCWGNNGYGRLGYGLDFYGVPEPQRSFLVGSVGDAANEMQNLPYVLLGSHEPVSVSMARDFTCALMKNGRSYCWGFQSDLNGHTRAHRGDGPGQMGTALPKVNLGSTFGRVISLSFNYGTACAINEQGEAKCWGANEWGKLGIESLENNYGVRVGQMGNSLPLVQLPGQEILQIEPGQDHMCALTRLGVVYCWGANSFGQTGRGDTANIGQTSGSMSTVVAVNLSGTDPELRVSKLSVGQYFNCALMTNGRVKCWGRNNQGQLGLGISTGLSRGRVASEMGDNLPFVDLGLNASLEPLQAIDVAVGLEHACAVLEDFTLKCWGRNTEGQRGVENNTSVGWASSHMGNALARALLTTDYKYTRVIAKDLSTCVQSLDNKLICWGVDWWERIGAHGSGRSFSRSVGVEFRDIQDLVAIDVGTARRVVQVDTSGVHACAVLDNQDTVCWGRNTLYGPLGAGFSGRNIGSAASDMGDSLGRVSY